MKSTYIIGAIVVVGALYFMFRAQATDPTAGLSKTILDTATTTNTNRTMEPQTTTTADGLQMTDEVVGTGVEAKAGDTVTVHYVGQLTNGKVFDASRNRGDTGFTFTIGAGQVIQGWEVGVSGMKEGGKRKLVIPPAMGYGAMDVGGGLIPANSTLIFEVELLKVQ